MRDRIYEKRYLGLVSDEALPVLYDIANHCVLCHAQDRRLQEWHRQGGSLAAHSVVAGCHSQLASLTTGIH
jgi:hypothetical protein